MHRLCTTFELSGTWRANRPPLRGTFPRAPATLPRRARRFLGVVVAALLLGACADEGGPSFAPDAATETAVRALTPSVIPTAAVVDRQPGEVDRPERGVEELAAARGATGAVSVRDGTTLTVYDAITGSPRSLTLAADVVATSSSEGGATIVALRRDAASLTLDVLGPEGAALRSLPLGAVAATPTAATPPLASPTAATVETITRDRVELSPDGGLAAVVSGEGDLVLVRVSPELSIARVVRDFGDVSTVGWTGDGTLALLATFDRSRSTASITGVPLDGRLRSILRLPADDGRRIVALSSPAGSPDVVYVARSDAGDSTAHNNLYRIPIVGGLPSVIVATGLIGPAGAVDRLAVADDGRTIAVTLLAPSGDDLAFHSLWLTDIEGSTPLRVNTGALGLVSRLAWSPEGLLVVGVQRERSATATRLVTVTERLGADGALATLSRIPSAATPAASPIAGPEGSPAASPIADPNADPATPVPAG